jgi:anti-sigma factor (TIGR02949 family)
VTPDELANCGEGCADALIRLEAYLDGALPEDDLQGIQAHLAACYPCTDRATFEEHLRALVRERCTESAPPELVARIRAQLAGAAGVEG